MAEEVSPSGKTRGGANGPERTGARAAWVSRGCSYWMLREFRAREARDADAPHRRMGSYKPGELKLAFEGADEAREYDGEEAMATGLGMSIWLSFTGRQGE